MIIGWLSTRMRKDQQPPWIVSVLVAFPVSLGALQARRDVLPPGPVFARSARTERGCAMHGYSILYSSEVNLGTIYPNGDVARDSLSVWVCGRRRHAA